MCQMEQHFLHEYIDGTLLALEKIILEEHLRTCAECRQELNRLKILDWDLRRLYQEEVSIPSELSRLRESILQSCFAEETSQGLNPKAITSTEIWHLQLATLNNSLKFITLMSPLTRKEKPAAPSPRKKTLLFRKIIGL